MRSISLESIGRIAKALAAQFGPNCEVLVHDLSTGEPDNTIVAIENGHVSNRAIGGGPSHIVLEALRAGNRELPDQFNYLTKTHDGRILRSSTVYLRDESGVLAGIFSLNYDLTELMMAQNIVSALVQTGNGREPERIPTNVNELLDDLLEQSVALVGKPVAMMNKDDKVRAIAFLSEAGAMLITKSGDKISNYFGISKYTLYSYLDSANNSNNQGQ